MSRKRVTEYLINEFIIFTGAKVICRNFSKSFSIYTNQKYIKYFSVTTLIDSWISNWMSEQNIENITNSDSNFAPIFMSY